MIFRFGGYELDEEAGELRRRGELVGIQPKPFELLRILLRERERIVSSEELFEALWPGVAVTPSSLTRAVSVARRAIGRLLPEAIYNGGTQSSEALVSRHVRFQGACLECLYPEPFVRRAEAAQACGRAALAPELPAATIGFVSALCGFLMACELVKDRLLAEPDHALDDARPVLRLDLLAGAPGPESVEAYAPRRNCFCREPETQRRIDALRAG